MNITGGFYGDDTETYCFGAFSRTTGGGHGLEVVGSGNSIINFNAADSWTGETSYTGYDSQHNNIQPYITVNIWRRIS